MKKSVAVLLTFIFLSLSGSASGEKIVFVTSDQPPYVMSEKGQPSGLDIDIVQELCSRLGVEAEIRVLPWKRALKNAEKGEADAIFAPRNTEERAAFLYYPSEPLIIERTVILAPKGSGIKINSLDDLKGKVVGVVRGYAHDPKFDNEKGIEKAECNDDTELVKIFSNGRVSLIAGSDEGSLRYVCKQSGFEAETVYVLNEAPTYIAFSKAKGEKGKALTEKFSQALRQLKEEGFIKKIESKYF